MTATFKLHWSPKSPYVRKVMVAANELGMVDRLELVRSVADMRRPNASIMADNPLSKIPTLVLQDGEPIYGSLTICELLDNLAAQPRLFPTEPVARAHVLTRHALADGLLDLLILWRNEREKPDERRTPEWISAFTQKTEAILDRMGALVPVFDAQQFQIDQITFGCALGYADFRFSNIGWRNGRAALAAWYETFARRPSAQATEIVDG